MIKVPNLVTKFAGNAAYGKRVIDATATRASVQAVAGGKGKSIINSVVSKAKDVDMSFGGHLGQMYARTSSVSSNSGLLSGLKPDAGEFKRVIQNIDSAETLTEMTNHAKAMNLDISENMTKLHNARKSGAATASIYGKDMDISKMTDDQFGAMMKSMAHQKKSYKNQIKELQDGYLSREQNLLEKARTYYSNPDYGKKRMAATGVVAGGAMVANRLASGGSLTRNEYGDRDIVGIPFI